jgi:hypothetical protein
VLRAAGETQTTEENIKDWLKLDEEDPGCQLLTEEEIATVMFFNYFHQHYLYIITFSIYLFFKFFSCLLGLSFASVIRSTGQSE